jgi:endonuclease G
MSGAGIESAAVSDKPRDVSRENNQTFSQGALALLSEQQILPLAANDKTATATLPDIAIVGPNSSRPKPVSDNPNLALGNPSNATADLSNKDNYLFVKDQYAMSYNSDHKTPNWVSWQLDSDWLGNSGRSGPFVPDPTLPAGFGKATPQDYTNSGYDRGHNCPSGVRTRSHEDNEATFNMSEIAPQTPDNNRGPWEKLENYSRELAGQGKELYIISGNEGSKGTIGNGVNVPETWFKVIVALPEKGMTAKDITADTQVIAVEMPNETGIRRDDWKKYTTTIGDIEKHTGYHFLDNVPANIRQALEQQTFH